MTVKIHDHTSASPQVIELSPRLPLKKLFLWLNHYKIHNMITAIVETLEFPNFGELSTSKIWFDSRHKILLMASWTEIMTS